MLLCKPGYKLQRWMVVLMHTKHDVWYNNSEWSRKERLFLEYSLESPYKVYIQLHKDDRSIDTCSVNYLQAHKAIIVTQSMKSYQVLVHSFVRNQLERRPG